MIAANSQANTHKSNLDRGPIKKTVIAPALAVLALGAVGAGLSNQFKSTREKTSVPVPALTVSPGVSERELPPSLWHKTTVTVQKGEGPYQVVKRIDPEIVTGPHSDANLTSQLVSEAATHELNEHLQPHQQFKLPDLNPGNPSPKLPEDTNTHIG